MALYVWNVVENPNPELRAAFVGVHQPRDGEEKKRDIVYATLNHDGFMMLREPLFVPFARGIGKAFEDLIVQDCLKASQNVV